MVRFATTSTTDAILAKLRQETAIGLTEKVSKPDAAERTLYVTPRGIDTNDGLSLKTAMKSLGAALSALGSGGGRIQLGVGAFSTADTHALRTGTEIIGCGPGLTSITYTGTGALFTTATPGTRSYFQKLRDVALVGPGKTSTAIAFDISDMSNVVVDGVNFATFGTGIKHSSVIIGGAVYNDISRSVINSCTVGVNFQASGSNGSRWRGVKFGACTTAVNMMDSNQNNFQACQFEANTTAVKIDATLAGLSDHNSFVNCRFEQNVTPWNIVSATVRDTEILWPEIFGTWATGVDGGTRTTLLASYPSLPPVGTTRRTLSRSGAYSLAAGDDVVVVNALNVTATLPSAATAAAGRQYVVKNVNATSLTVASASGLIDGAATLTLSQWESATFVSDGADWLRIGRVALQAAQVSGMPVSVRKATDTTLNNVAVKAADPDLTVPVVGGAVYKVDLVLVYSASQAADIQIGWAVPSGSAFDWTANGLATNTTSTGAAIGRGALTHLGVGQVGAAGVGTKLVALPSGVFVAGASGSLALTWGQLVATADDAVVHAGSTLVLTRLS